MAEPTNLIWLTYVLFPAVGIAGAAVIMGWLYRSVWDKRGARLFFGLIGIGVLWALTQLLYLLVPTMSTGQLLLELQTVVAMVAFVTFVVFVSVYTESGFHRHPIVLTGNTVVVGGAVLLVATSQYHDLLFASVQPVSDPFEYLYVQPGLGFVAILVLVLLLIGYSWIALVIHFLDAPQASSTQMLLILAGGFSIAITEILGNTGMLPAHGMNHAVYGTIPFLLFATVALFRLGMFDIQPVARNTIVENLRDPIVILDIEGRISDYNTRATQLWPALSVSAGEPLETVSPQLATALEFDQLTDEVTQQLELTIDGEKQHFSATVSPIEHESTDGIRWYAVVLRDITEIVRSREQLAEQNERLDQVASTISHDLRNPIQIADGYTDFLEDDLDALDGDSAAVSEAREHLEEVESALDRMQTIIDDVLTLARLGSRVEETERVSLEVVSQTAWSGVQTHEGTLEIDGNRDLVADRSRLCSILENLFRNAVEHGGSDVTVTVGATESGFFVQDTGPGIPTDAIDTVFEYGYTTASDGTGFGLAIVRSMAESHGWDVSVDETYDDGARFEFEVPELLDRGLTGKGEATGDE